MDVATATPEELVAAGLIPHVDYADACNPGPLWLADIAAEAHKARVEQALHALGKLEKADVVAILEAIGGK